MHSMLATLLSFLLLAKPSRSMRALLMRDSPKSLAEWVASAGPADRASVVAGYLAQPDGAEEEVELTAKRDEIRLKVAELYPTRGPQNVVAKTDQFIQGFDWEVDHLLTFDSAEQVRSAELVKLLAAYHRKFGIEKMPKHFTGDDAAQPPFPGYDGHYHSLFLIQREAVRLFADDDYWLKQTSLNVDVTQTLYTRSDTPYEPTSAIPLHMRIGTKRALQHLALVIGHPVFDALPGVLAGEKSFTKRHGFPSEYLYSVEAEIRIIKKQAFIVADDDEQITHLRWLLNELLSFAASLRADGVTTLPGLAKTQGQSSYGRLRHGQ